MLHKLRYGPLETFLEKQASRLTLFTSIALFLAVWLRTGTQSHCFPFDANDEAHAIANALKGETYTIAPLYGVWFQFLSFLTRTTDPLLLGDFTTRSVLALTPALLFYFLSKKSANTSVILITTFFTAFRLPSMIGYGNIIHFAALFFISTLLLLSHFFTQTKNKMVLIVVSCLIAALIRPEYAIIGIAFSILSFAAKPKNKYLSLILFGTALAVNLLLLFYTPGLKQTSSEAFWATHHSFGEIFTFLNTLGTLLFNPPLRMNTGVSAFAILAEISLLIFLSNRPTTPKIALFQKESNAPVVALELAPVALSSILLCVLFGATSRHALPLLMVSIPLLFSLLPLPNLKPVPYFGSLFLLLLCLLTPSYAPPQSCPHSFTQRATLQFLKSHPNPASLSILAESHFDHLTASQLKQFNPCLNAIDSLPVDPLEDFNFIHPEIFEPQSCFRKLQPLAALHLQEVLLQSTRFKRLFSEPYSLPYSPWIRK